VIRICPTCGALLLEASKNCTFCEIQAEEATSSRPLMSRAANNSETVEPEWRSEVTRRLGNYRARRSRLNPEVSQPDLPFRATRGLKEPSVTEVKDSKEEIRERPRTRSLAPRRDVEPMEICIQPELDFESPAHQRAHPQTALVPVARLAERRWAGALDGLFVGLTGAGFMALFHALGGQISFGKTDAIVYVSVLYMFYALYFFLFTSLAGPTLGMQLLGLAVVRLDGSLPDTRQLLWRSFGYLLSGATVLLGFFWALWDEDHFTWQDRISQTYVTAAPPFIAAEPEVRPIRQTFARR
jgi:uncharacterized RDD family membrane protein YckC